MYTIRFVWDEDVDSLKIEGLCYKLPKIDSHRASIAVPNAKLSNSHFKIYLENLYSKHAFFKTTTCHPLPLTIYNVPDVWRMYLPSKQLWSAMACYNLGDVYDLFIMIVCH